MKLGKNSFINKFSKAYPKKSCDNLIKWFEQNNKMSLPGVAGIKKLDNLVRIRISNAEYWNKSLSIYSKYLSLPNNRKNYKHSFLFYPILSVFV